ncbi:MAG: oxygenase MpaB family protein [Myxococcota bacterium]
MEQERWSDEILDAMRTKGDPIADDTVATILESDGLEGLRELLGQLQRNDVPEPDALPDGVKAYFDRTEILPAWADPELMERGARVFRTNGLLATMVLFAGSLPAAYAAKRSVQVLALSRRLQSDVKRRIVEMAQLVLDVVAEGGMGKGGYAIRTIQKVRLIHGAIRHYIQYPTSPLAFEWDRQWGTPINQEDLAGTLMTFCAAVLQGLAKYDVHIEPDNAEAYVHLWNVVGYVLGVSEQLLPRDVADAYRLHDRVMVRNHAPSEAGRLLTAALVEFLEQEIPGKALDGLAASNIRYLVGDRVADMLGVEPRHFTDRLISLERTIWGWTHDVQELSPRIRQLMGKMTYELLCSIERHEIGGERTKLRIPAGMMDHPPAGPGKPHWIWQLWPFRLFRDWWVARLLRAVAALPDSSS